MRNTILVLALVLCSCHLQRMKEKTWDQNRHVWDNERLPLKVGILAPELLSFESDVKAAIKLWNRAAGCKILKYVDGWDVDIFITIDYDKVMAKSETAIASSWLRVYGNGVLKGQASTGEIYVHQSPHAHPWPVFVFAHELGHVLGLAHDYPYLRTSVMNGNYENYNLNTRVWDSDGKALNKQYCK